MPMATPLLFALSMVDFQEEGVFKGSGNFKGGKKE